MVYKTRAVVIKTQEYKEADKIVWLYSEKLGKISCIAHGARRNKSKLFSLSLQFCFADLIVYKGRNMFTINEGEIIDSFQGFLNDFDSLIYASYFNELIDIAVNENESNHELFSDYVSALYFIKNKACDIEILTRAFELKILKYTGFNMEYYNNNVADSLLNIIRYLSSTPITNVYKVSLSDKLKRDLYDVIKQFIYENYSRVPKSLDMINKIKEESKNE